MKKNSSKRQHGIKMAAIRRPKTSEAKKRQKSLARLRTAEKLDKGEILR